VFDGGVKPNPIFSVFHRFQYQNNPRFLSGLYRVIRALTNRLTPVITKIKLNRVGKRGASVIWSHLKTHIIDFGKGFMLKICA
jgi:hypothetical protein